MLRTAFPDVPSALPPHGGNLVSTSALALVKTEEMFHEATINPNNGPRKWFCLSALSNTGLFANPPLAKDARHMIGLAPLDDPADLEPLVN